MSVRPITLRKAAGSILLSGWISAGVSIAAGVAPAHAQIELIDVATDTTDPDNRDDSEPSIAVNPVNPNHVVVVTFSGGWTSTRPAPIWESLDGGRTWNKVEVIPQPDPGWLGPKDQKIAFANNGALYIAVMGEQNDTFRAAVYRQNGSGLIATRVVGPYGGDQPHLDVDWGQREECSGRIVSPWLNIYQKRHRAMASRSRPDWSLMDDTGVGVNTTYSNRTTRVAISPDSRAYVLYKTREGVINDRFERAHFWVKRSDDCGSNWSALGDRGVSVHGTAAVQTLYTDNFGNPNKGPVARARSSDAWIAVDPTNADVYVAYVRRDPSGFAQIYVAQSTDGGSNWQSTRVTDGTAHSAFPHVAVNSRGVVGVLYTDYTDSGPQTIFRHRFASAPSGQEPWQDSFLQQFNFDGINNYVPGFLWGDYQGLTTHDTAFLGVFTGESIGRTVRQLDPIFFRVAMDPNEVTSQTPAAYTEPVSGSIRQE
jgi:hypothetical protein